MTMPNDKEPTCRLCRAPLRGNETRRNLCDVCDEYAQHVALHSNQGLERIVGELQNGPLFQAASRNLH